MFRTVGERTSVRTARRARPAAGGRALTLRVDLPLLLVVITLLVFGMVMVYSASYDYSMMWFEDTTYVFGRQILWVALGIAVATVLAFLDYHIWRRLAVPAMGVTVASLIGVLLVSEVRNNAVRTFLDGSVQPSELAKLMMIIYLAVWLFAKRDQLSDINFGLIPLAAILGLVGGLIFVQPDLSAVITIFFLGGLMFFLAGGDLKQLIILVVVALLVGLLVVQLNLTGSDRVTSFQAGLKDPTQASYHVRRSLEAFVKGQWLGVGIGKSETKLTGLPFPSTDSIFAVIGEETGVLGSVILICLYLVFMWRGIAIALRAPDLLGTLLAAGLSVWLAVEAFVNMSSMVNLLPFAGNALPLFSSGGSNMLVSMAAIGILLNVSRQSEKNEEKSGRTFGAVVDLRWRDRWRREPRARRTGRTGRRG